MKDEKKAQMFINLTSADKTRFVWQAKAEGKSLEEWVVENLNAVCDRKGTKVPDKK